MVKANDIKPLSIMRATNHWMPTVLISQGSLLNIAEMIFNLRDLNKSMEIIILVSGVSVMPADCLRQLVEHPIEGTRIVTRRQLQKQLHAYFTTVATRHAAFRDLVIVQESEAMKMTNIKFQLPRFRQLLTLSQPFLSSR